MDLKVKCRSLLTTICAISLIICCLLWGHFVSQDFDITKHPLRVTQVLCAVICSKTFVDFFLGNLTGTSRQFRVTDIAICLCFTIFSSFVYHCIAVLFGAAPLRSVSETYHLALLLTCTSVIPCFMVMGASADAWHRVWIKISPEDHAEEVARAVSLSSLLGAWLGAIPIPLDWDRPWQVWPISCVIGASLGYCAGLVLVHIRLAWRQWRLNKLKII